MINIIDNYLPEPDFINLKSIIFDVNWPWHFNDFVVHQEEVEDSTQFQFVHVLFRDHNWIGAGQQYIYPLINKMSPLAWLRIKMNLNTRTETPSIGSYHCDIPDLVADSYETAIYYLNTNNGKTLFEDGTYVDSVANRLVTFPGTTKHAGCTSTDTSRRVLINLNYIKY